jgi:hypothetical protein
LHGLLYVGRVNYATLVIFFIELAPASKGDIFVQCVKCCNHFYGRNLSSGAINLCQCVSYARKVRLGLVFRTRNLSLSWNLFYYRFKKVFFLLKTSLSCR